jgi:hypothetical protein
MIEVKIGNELVLEKAYTPNELPIGTIVSLVPYSRSRAEHLRIVTVDGLYDFDGSKQALKTNAHTYYYKIPDGTVLTLTVTNEKTEPSGN